MNSSEVFPEIKYNVTEWTARVFTIQFGLEPDEY